ncbi:MAG: glycosyltransferase family 4 protein [Firmicutes bacterium]|nr:glycosyltransferase family 4 protein [Bacillota bacterium]
MNILIDAAAAYQYHSTGIGAYAAELINAIKNLSPAEQISLHTGNTIVPGDSSLIRPETRTDFWERIHDGGPVDDRHFDLYHNLHNGIAMKGGARKTVVTIHDMIPYVLPQYCGTPYREMFLEETRNAAEQADMVITVSQNSKRDILRFTNVPEEKIRVIYEAPKRFCRPLPEKMTEDFLRSKYGIRPPFFLYVGGFNRRKNVAGLIRGYAKICRELPKICPLVIAGKEGSRRFEAEQLGENLGITPYLRFVGHVPDGDLPFFYNRCEALIYPSFYEGFGLPPIEAAACGAAVITSNRSSLPEVMVDAALYIDPDRPEDIGEKIFAVATDKDLKQKMQRKALARAATFSYEETARRTLAIYENLCR